MGRWPWGPEDVHLGQEDDRKVQIAGGAKILRQSPGVGITDSWAPSLLYSAEKFWPLLAFFMF